MAMGQKRRLRVLLDRLGLLPFALAMNRLRSGVFVLGYLRALTRYLYNNILTYVPIHTLRVAYLRYVLRVKVGKSSFVHLGCRFEPEGNGISIGKNSVVGRRAVLMGDIRIDDNVSITAEVYIFTTSHDVHSMDFRATHSRVTIQERAWIGARAMILPGVTVGAGAVLAAGSIATKNIAEFCISAGAPAREIGTRRRDIAYTLDYSPFFQ